MPKDINVSVLCEELRKFEFTFEKFSCGHLFNSVEVVHTADHDFSRVQYFTRRIQRSVVKDLHFAADVYGEIRILFAQCLDFRNELRIPLRFLSYMVADREVELVVEIVVLEDFLQRTCSVA